MKSLPPELKLTKTQDHKTGLRLTITPTSYSERLNTHFSREMKNATPQTQGEKIERACEKLITQTETPRSLSREDHLSACEKITRRDSFSQLSPYFQNLIRQQAKVNSSQTCTKQQYDHHHAQSSCGSSHHQAKISSRPRSSLSFSAASRPHSSSATPRSKPNAFFTQQSTAPLKQSTNPTRGIKRLRAEIPQAGSHSPTQALNNLSLNPRIPRSSSLPDHLNMATAQGHRQKKPNLRLRLTIPSARTAISHFHRSLAGDVKRLSSNSGAHSKHEVISSLNNVMASMTPRAGHAEKSLAQRVAFGPAMPKIDSLLSSTVQAQVQAIADDDLAQNLDHLLMNQ